jgi:hypothetical protein
MGPHRDDTAMSHPALPRRWRWLLSRQAGAAHPAAGDPVAAQAGAAPLDARRRLQLVLAGLWLLDGVLQLQTVMFTRQFPAMLAQSAAGQPAVVAGPVNWAARLTAGHPAPANAAFAALQIALGLGLAWRPAVRAALAASVAWSLAVWWLGEGLGGLLAGTASPVEGAPGAALLYAVAAVLLWPPQDEPRTASVMPGQPDPASAVSSRPSSRLDDVTGKRGRAVPFVVGQAIGIRGAAVVWLVLWGGLAVLAVQPAVRAPHAFGGLLADLADDAPGWLARADQQAATALGGHGLVASGILAVLLAAIGLAGCRPDRTPAAARTAVAVAVVFGAVTAAAGGFGELFTGMATDPGTGPVLALVALAYWPRIAGPRAGGVGAGSWG